MGKHCMCAQIILGNGTREILLYPLLGVQRTGAEYVNIWTNQNLSSVVYLPWSNYYSPIAANVKILSHAGDISKHFWRPNDIQSVDQNWIMWSRENKLYFLQNFIFGKNMRLFFSHY